MKKVKFALLFIVIGLVQACNSGNSDSVDAAKNSNDKKDSSATATTMATDTGMTSTAPMPVDKDASDFAVEAANGGMMEVELGTYAQQNASSQRVKDFGAMMVRDHSKANDELKQIAGAKKITLPMEVGADGKKNMDDLMKKKGKDFDKAYMNMMMDDHKKVINAFEKTAKDSKDPELKNFAMKTLPTLHVHLDSTKAIMAKK